MLVILCFITYNILNIYLGIKMIGIDLTKKSRFKENQEEIAKKILHSMELKKYLEDNDKLKFLATRWAIKEAIFKCDNQYKNFSEINITKDNVGRYIFKDFEISTTNDDDYIIAIVFNHKN
ncbi:hypothetical protein MSATCC14277_0240 [Metamycoplasma salivarium]|nr:hypothetical protein MSATCC14277_0240 [Metamycoplasma salivarium]